MFHVEQICVLFGVASACLGATLVASGAENSLPCPAPQRNVLEENHGVYFNLALATDNQEAATETTLGLQALLLGDDDEAEQHFTAALAQDETSPLAYAGLCILTKNTATRQKEVLSALKEKWDALPGTPAEAFYLATFLKMLERDTASAANDWSARADRYRRDLFSACWAVLLLHYGDRGYDSSGSALSMQQDALKRADKLFEQAVTSSNIYIAFNPYLYFVRALVEENAPQISDTAIHAVEMACSYLPESPVVHHLHGHLLYRRGEYQNAVAKFRKARELAKLQKKEILALRARLYESVALWSAGQDKDALAIRRELNTISSDWHSLEAKHLFLTWESRTLPLRLMILRGKLPMLSELTAAYKTAVPTPDVRHASAARCIAFSLRARIEASQGRKKESINFLHQAEEQYTLFEKQREELIKTSLLYLTPWTRLNTACIVAVNKAKAELYPSSADTWNQNIAEALKEQGDSTLPPVVPQR